MLKTSFQFYLMFCIFLKFCFFSFFAKRQTILRLIFRALLTSFACNFELWLVIYSLIIVCVAFYSCLVRVFAVIKLILFFFFAKMNVQKLFSEFRGVRFENCGHF